MVRCLTITKDAIVYYKARHNAKNHAKNQPRKINMSSQDRLTDMEIRLTHQDDTIDQLNQVVADQQQRLTRLEQALRNLANEHRDLKDGLASDIMDQPPPHY
jgi:SlyX protein